MLADPRSRALVDNFAGQWLTMRKAADVSARSRLSNPEFDENLRDAFVKEAQLLVDSQLRADRSIIELVTADYSFLNERLARHTACPMCMASDSAASRSRRRSRRRARSRRRVDGDVVSRSHGAGVARLVGARQSARHATPAAAGQRARPGREGEDGRKRSMREQMEIHRRNPACAACHVRMDPLGFAMEQFDPIGKWRTTSAGVPIDAVGGSSPMAPDRRASRACEPWSRAAAISLSRRSQRR